MGLGADLGPAQLAAALPGRPVRAYPALVSTEAAALAWAREGAPQGAVVVADYQAAAHGHDGSDWHTVAGRGLGLSVVLRPNLPAEREGWPFVLAGAALLNAGEATQARWPAWVDLAGEAWASYTLRVQLADSGVAWAVASIWIKETESPRPAALARVLAELDRSCAEADTVAAERYRRGCLTLGRPVRARLLPLGPRGIVVSGTALEVTSSGALVIDTADAGRVHVPAENLGAIEDPA